MSVTNPNNKPALTGIKKVSDFLNSDSIKNKFTEIMGEKGIGFISSVLSVCNSNKSLQNADTNSIYTAALMAATLDLPINPNLGFAYIVPYSESFQDEKGNWLKRQVAQFQMGYKGFIQLAQRSGQFKIINASDVREGEIIKYDRLTGEITFDWEQNSSIRLSKKIVGYISYFELNNGFRNTLFMSIEEVEAHAKKYSQNYKKHDSGLWKDEFDSMARKTVTKLNLSKNAPLSIEMRRAVISDQAIIRNDSFVNSDNDDAIDIPTEYVDNKEETKEEKVATKKEEVKQAKEKARAAEKPVEKNIETSTKDESDIYTRIGNCKNIEELTSLEKLVPKDDHDLSILFDDKKRELKQNTGTEGNLFDSQKMA